MSAELTNIKLISKIAHGAFGEIYECVDTTTNTKLAIKIEKRTGIFQLKHEYLVYRRLESATTPQVYEYGKMEHDGSYANCMTMELLGPSLEKLFAKQQRRFSLKTVLMIGKECLLRIEAMHHKHMIHRDIKPDNFVTDRRLKKIYLIDYGLSKEFRNPKTLIHRPIRTDKNLTGTARYASLNTHQGVEQSRRDDLESLGFCIIYFLKGRLPWQGLKAETKGEKYAKIKRVKEETSIFQLCEDLPNEIYLFLIHVRNLQYDESPDYAYLESLLNNCMRSRGLDDDCCYDWFSNDRSN